jgi:hypothetical protein
MYEKIPIPKEVVNVFEITQYIYCIIKRFQELVHCSSSEENAMHSDINLHFFTKRD